MNAIFQNPVIPGANRPDGRRWWRFWLALAVSVVAPAVVWVVLFAMPSGVYEKGAVGTFVDADPGIIVTTVRTTTSVISVNGGFSAGPSTALEVRNSGSQGMQLCATGTTICTDIHGVYAGRLLHIPGTPRRELSQDERSGAFLLSGLWLPAGLVVTAVMGVLCSNDGSDGQHDS